jgi:quinol monooxygenase YgiN
MIVVNATIVSSAETIATVREALATMETHSRAESGCQDYTFSVEVNNPDVIRITEKWDSMDDLLAHFQEPHMADFQAVLAEHPPKSLDANFYEASAVTPPGM